MSFWSSGIFFRLMEFENNGLLHHWHPSVLETGGYISRYYHNRPKSVPPPSRWLSRYNIFLQLSRSTVLPHSVAPKPLPGIPSAWKVHEAPQYERMEDAHDTQLILPFKVGLKVQKVCPEDSTSVIVSWVYVFLGVWLCSAYQLAMCRSVIRLLHILSHIMSHVLADILAW